MMAGPLSLLQRLIATPKDLDRVRDLFEPHVVPRSKTPIDHQIIANQLLRNIEDDPEALTHILYQDQLAKAAYQFSPRKDGTYLPYLVSFEKGLGTPMLEEAYQTAKKAYPENPVFLYSTPEALPFYRKQKQWRESEFEGVPKFERKAQGGLVQMKECNCGRT